MNTIIEHAKQQLNARHIPQDVVSVCHAIMDHVAKAPNIHKHLTFLDLYRISPSVPDDVFYDAVFLLTKHPYNILIQNFEALNSRGVYQVVPDREQLLEDMKNDDFNNPFTGQQLSEAEFGNQVLTFFSPSKELLTAVDYA